MLLNEPHGVPIRKGPPRPQDALAPFLATNSSYEMTGEDDIGDALTQLAASGDAISMYAQGSRDVVLGRILSVDPELPHFVMELNEGASLRPGIITFVSWLRTAKLQFRLKNPEWTSLPGKPNLIQMVFPETCAVLDRREAERVETPLGTNFMASFVLNSTSARELPIYDISLGGIGLRCSKLDAKGLLKGRKLKEVSLELGEEEGVVIELEVRFTRAFRSFLLGEQLHIGCMFIHKTPELDEQLQGLLDLLNKAHQQR